MKGATMKEDDLQTIQAFLKANKLMTISTIEADSGRPQSALVSFAELPSLEILFQTVEYSRKYRNLNGNQAVALVIGWDLENYRTLQYEGVAEQIPADEAEQYHRYFLDKESPASEIILKNPRARFFRVKPTWLRYSDYSCGNAQFIEHTF